jgi:hypothetical protein
VPVSHTSAPAKVALFALALLIPAAHGSELKGTARLSFGAGADSNGHRDYEQLGTQADAFAYASAFGRLDYLAQQARAVGEYEIGARKFLQLLSEDVLVQSGTVEGALSLGPSWSIGLEGRGKDRRGGSRDYSDLFGGPFVALAAGAWDLRLRTAAHRFVYRPDFSYSFKAMEVGLTGQYRLSRRHTLLLVLDAGIRNYNADARPNPNQPTSPSLTGRQDVAALGGAGYSYRGPIALTLTYSYGEARSNSFGETTLRHRLALTAGARLPGDFTVVGQAALQLTRYPDGPYPTPEIILIEDDNHNSVALKVLRPLFADLELELRVALYSDRLPHVTLYSDRLPQNKLTYLRGVASMGFAWRL